MIIDDDELTLKSPKVKDDAHEVNNSKYGSIGVSSYIHSPQNVSPPKVRCDDLITPYGSRGPTTLCHPDIAIVTSKS